MKKPNATEEVPMRKYPRLAFLLLPYTRAELPGWGRLLKWAGVMVGIHDTSWKSAPTVTLRGKLHRHLMRLNLSDWAQRMTYFLGRYYELEVQLVLNSALRQGDHFADIGSNIGMIALHAQSCVGPNGRVTCFEPNPDCVKLLQENLVLNSISNVTVHPCALSDVAGSLKLNLTSEHTGTATLAEVDGTKKSVVVHVRVGDDMVGAVDMVKIDVEGFELHVLNGLRQTIAAFRPLIITELVEAQLNNAGTSVKEVAAVLLSLGYKPHGIGTRRKHFRRHLILRKLEQESEFASFNDVLWMHPLSDRWTALESYITH